MNTWKKKPKILITNKYFWCNKKILISEKEFTENNYERLKIKKSFDLHIK